jgi:multiple sugar transport system permease protein
LPMVGRVLAVAVLIRTIDLFRIYDYVHAMTERSSVTATIPALITLSIARTA